MEINGEQVNEIVQYADLNLSPEVMRALEKKGYVQATCLLYTSDAADEL